jgi:glycosyltransferase involved in cell wall biosynthesis
MRIGLIMHELLVEGGGERQCVSLAQALARRGHQVVLYTNDYDRSNCFPETCKEFTVRNLGRGPLPWLRKPRFLRAYLDMWHCARLIHDAHEIWNPHHWPAQWGAVWLKRKLGGSVVWMCNDVPDFRPKALNPRSIRGVMMAPLYWLYYFYDRRQNSKIDLTLFLSNWAKQQYLAIYPGSTRVVRSGMDPDRFAPGGNRASIRSRFAYANDEFVLLWLGIMMPHRRLEDAIQAIGLLKPSGIRVRLLLAGSDRSFPDYVSSLKSLVQESGLDELVTFTGKVAEAEVQDFYSACDAFLFPNEQQTWGLAVMEAMSCGRLALISRGAAVHEVFTDMQDAVLFSPRDPQDMARKIKLLLERPGLAEEIAARGMRTVRENYTWDRFAAQVEDACQQATGCEIPVALTSAEMGSRPPA